MMPIHIRANTGPPPIGTRGPLLSRRAAAGGYTGDWWLANGTIDNANVEEYVENLTATKVYEGDAIANDNPWTFVVHSTGIVSATNSGAKYMYSGNSDIVAIGMNGTNKSIYYGSWANREVFLDTNVHIWFFVQTGSSIQCYLDNVATGTAISTNKGVNVGRWMTVYNHVSNGLWPNELYHGALYNIALNELQRNALYGHINSL